MIPPQVHKWYRGVKSFFATLDYKPRNYFMKGRDSYAEVKGVFVVTVFIVEWCCLTNL
jgi:hypothetical protein